MRMTISEYVMRLECLQESLADNKPFELAVNSIHASRVERIFTNGINTAGSQIGQYSTEPIYVNPLTSSPKKFATEGKTGNKVFKSTGKAHVTKFFPDGYKGFKSAIGKRSDYVNLTLFGDLRSNFSNRSRATKISANEYQTGLDAANSKKREGLENKYGKVFFHSKDEIQEFQKIQLLELQKAQSICLGK